VLHDRVDDGQRNSSNAFGRRGANSGEAPQMTNGVRMRTVRRRASRRRARDGASRGSTAVTWATSGNDTTIRCRELIKGMALLDSSSKKEKWRAGKEEGCGVGDLGQ
jgi:hypothetical protein